MSVASEDIVPRPLGDFRPLKVAMVSPYDYGTPGGVNTHIANLAHQLRGRGHTVKVIAPMANSKDREPEVDFVPIGRPVPVPIGGSIARVSLSYWRERMVRDLLKREAFDLIHLHEPAAPWLPLTMLRCSDTTNIGTFHAFKSNRFYRLWGYYARRYFPNLHGRIAVSKPALDYVSKLFPGEYTIIPNGVDIEHFAAPRASLEQFADGKLNILFVSRLERRKGLRHVIKAFSRLKWQYQNLRLIVVGSGSPGEEVLGLISQHNLKDVVLVGGVSAEDLPRYYQTADIFCAPNTGKESFGIILAEAMAASKPIVASRIDGFSRVISNGVEGFLVPPGDDEALADALKRLIDDPVLRQEMGARGLISVEAYRWDKIAADVEALYRAKIAARLGSGVPA